MALVPKDLFVSETTDFASMLQTSDQPDTFRLELCTLAGTKHFLDNLVEETTLAEVLLQVALLVKAPAFCLKLLLDDQLVDCQGQTLADAGLAKPNASVTLVRCPANRAEWTQLFSDLISAIEGRRAEDARRLVDMGAGLDGDGNALKAGQRMRLPGDRTVHEGEPGNTMLHLAIRQGLTDLALYLIARNVDLESCNDVGRSLIMMAILKKQPVVVDTLLRAQVNLSTRDYLGNTALSYALKGGNDMLAAQLVTLQCAMWTGTNPWCQTEQLRTADLSSASLAQSSNSTFAGLVPTSRARQIGCDTVLRGEFPVLTCCACGLPLTAVSLLKSGAGHEGTDVHSRTALHYAHDLDVSSYGAERDTLLVALLENGANAEAMDTFGNPPECGIQSPEPAPVASSFCSLSALFRRVV